MSVPFERVPSHPIGSGTPVFRYRQGLPEIVNMTSPATDVMTDLRRVKVVTIEPQAAADKALQKMIHAGVRLLIVTAADDAVVGIVTARDVMGERPVKVATSERIPRERVTVQQIMTTRDHIDAMYLNDVLRARVGDIVVSLRDAGRQHALVVDDGAKGEVVCGIFSATQIGRQLGVDISPAERVQSFAELERLLKR
jgi:CBS domain-containing protein